ncbi:MAG: metallophosphoesterase [Lachnospiraceae bacterium]|nr:metallophosphoesterase [Lachnospiraceae bacterium]
MIALFILPVYVLANFYVCRWFMKWLDAICHGHLNKVVRVLIHIVYWTLSLAMYIAALIPEGTVRRIFNVAGTYWYGVVIYILLIFVIFDAVRLIMRKAQKTPKGEMLISRNKFIALGAFCCIFILLIAILGGINARTLHNTEYEIDIDKDGGKLDNLNIVMVADQHMGYSVRSSMMRDMVERINSYNPDIVIMAGDIFDNNYDALDDPEELLKIYKSINSKYGVYAVYGNHDVSEMIIGGFTFPHKEKLVADERMDKFLEDAGIKNLRDEYVVIDDSFYLYGRPDYQKEGRGIEGRKGPSEVTAGMNQDMPIILIDHQPRELQELANAGVDLDLSGHTHDGQIFPLNLTAKLMWENPCGLIKKDNMYSLVTSGVGFYGPGIRVGTRAEVVNLKVNFTGSKK